MSDVAQMAQMATMRRTERHATFGGNAISLRHPRRVVQAMPPMDPPEGTDVSSLAARAGVAQLAEHNLPKVGVAGSIPVSRSIFMPIAADPISSSRHER